MSENTKVWILAAALVVALAAAPVYFIAREALRRWRFALAMDRYARSDSPPARLAARGAIRQLWTFYSDELRAAGFAELPGAIHWTAPRWEFSIGAELALLAAPILATLAAIILTLAAIMPSGSRLAEQSDNGAAAAITTAATMATLAARK